MTAFESSQLIFVHTEHITAGGFMAETFLRLDQVRERTGLCRSAVYGLEGLGPQSLRVGHRAKVYASSDPQPRHIKLSKSALMVWGEQLDTALRGFISNHRVRALDADLYRHGIR